MDRLHPEVRDLITNKPEMFTASTNSHDARQAIRVGIPAPRMRPFDSTTELKPQSQEDVAIDAPKPARTKMLGSHTMQILRNTFTQNKEGSPHD